MIVVHRERSVFEHGGGWMTGRACLYGKAERMNAGMELQMQTTVASFFVQSSRVAVESIVFQ